MSEFDNVNFDFNVDVQCDHGLYVEGGGGVKLI